MSFLSRRQTERITLIFGACSLHDRFRIVDLTQYSQRFFIALPLLGIAFVRVRLDHVASGIVNGSSLRTRIPTTESVSLCEPMRG